MGRTRGRREGASETAIVALPLASVVHRRTEYLGLLLQSKREEERGREGGRERWFTGSVEDSSAYSVQSSSSHRSPSSFCMS